MEQVGGRGMKTNVVGMEGSIINEVKNGGNNNVHNIQGEDEAGEIGGDRYGSGNKRKTSGTNTTQLFCYHAFLRTLLHEYKTLFTPANYDVSHCIDFFDILSFLPSLLPQKGRGMMYLQSNLVSKWMRWREVVAAP